MALCKNDGGQDRRVAVTVLFTLGALLEHATRMLRLPSNAVALWSTAGMPIISISQLSQINKVKLVASCGEHCPGVGGVGQADVHAMQNCLGQTIGKKKDACRQACASSCNHANLS